MLVMMHNIQNFNMCLVLPTFFQKSDHEYQSQCHFNCAPHFFVLAEIAMCSQQT